MSIWKEIRNLHVDEETMKTYIDAYLTDDDWEEGRVIAKVDMQGGVEYIDKRAMTDEYAQEIINSTRFDILALLAYDLYKQDWCEIRGYNLKDYDEEHGFGGESFICYNEFKGAEFRDEEYMANLLGDKFAMWLEIVDV